MSEEHYCSIHDTTFFMKGKMKGYAHPIKDDDGDDTGKWCNEDAPPQPPPEAVQSKSEPVKGGSNNIPHVDARTMDIHRQVGFKEANRLCASHLFPFEKLYSLADLNTKWLNGDITTDKANGQIVSAVTKMTK